MSPGSLKQPWGDETKLEYAAARETRGKRDKRKAIITIVPHARKIVANYDQELRDG
jgi:hypothetical protein